MTDSTTRKPVILPYKGILPKIHESVYMTPTTSVIGDVEIGEDSSLWHSVVVRGDVNIIRIGKRSNLQDATVVHVDRKKYGTFIGDDVTVGHSVLLHACTLQDRAFVGMQACVMDGSVVESEGLVAAGSLVTPGTIIKSGEIWAGRPAKFMRKLTEEEKAYNTQTTENYVRLAADYRG